MQIIKKISISIVILFFSTAFAADAEIMFSPQGTVKDVRQVRAQFSDSMVSFGNPRNTDPFTIQCPVPGKGLWEDDKNWVYDFTADLPGGINCKFLLKTEKTLSNKKIQGPKEFHFSTGGPAIVATSPYQGSEIVEDQYFVLALDAKSNLSSVSSHAYFTVEGLEEKIPAEIVEGETKEAILNSNSVKNNYTFDEVKYEEMIVLRAKRKFPNSMDPKKTKNVQLIWEKGITSKSGVKLEDSQVFQFSARHPFTATFSCERENATSDCIPLSEIRINFSSLVALKDAKNFLIKKGTQIWKPTFSKSDEESDYVGGVVFKGPWPAKSNFTLELPKNLRDEDNRQLQNATSFPLSFKTVDFPPLAKFSRGFGIVELHGEPIIPVTLRNLEPELKTKILQINPSIELERLKTKIFRTSEKEFLKIVSWMSGFETHQDSYDLNGVSIFKSDDKVETRYIKKPNGPNAFEVVGISLSKPGFYITEIESPILGKSQLEDKGPYFVKSAALVTNMVVHFKKGRESSIAWVTSLDKGEPVSGAVVSIRNCKGNVLTTVETNENGIAKLGIIPQIDQVPNCQNNDDWSRYNTGLYVIAEKDGDFTFTHSSWSDGIESYRFDLRNNYESQKAVLGHTVFDRTLLRAGETVHMKHIFRKHTSENILFSDDTALPKTVQISHSGSNQNYFLPLTWSKNKTATSDWKIPDDTKLGKYTVTLLDQSSEEAKKIIKNHGYYEGNSIETGEFRVEEFRLPLMKAKIFTPQKPVIASKAASIDVHLDYFSGGPAAEQPVQIRYQLEKLDSKSFDLFDGFRFGEPSPVENKTVENPQEQISKTIPTKLDKTGTATVSLDLGDIKSSNDVQVEFEYTDPNGQTQTSSSHFSKYAASRLIGIKLDGWMAKREKFNFSAAVVDLYGKPVANASVEVTLHQNKTYSHRKKILGGFYSYENKTETKNIATVCSGKTDEKGYVYCESSSPVSGNLFLHAKTLDSSGNTASTYQSFWLWDQDPWMFELSDSDRIDLIPEKKKYSPGETAKFQVRMPFEKANVLVTVEREGILDSFVTQITRKKPVIEVPIKKNFTPNVFISALVVRGRVGEVQPTSLVDLGKPAYKLGISEIFVDWKAHELNVHVIPEKSEYQTRQKAKVKISVRKPDGNIPSINTEILVAAVDESLLDLSPNKSWNLIEAMMSPRSYEVETMTAQMQVVGKRHFGLKSLTPGGGGGSKTTRELFDTLLLWSTNLKLNEKGEAEIEVPLNDSLTSFKIVAIANSESGFFGTGSSSIRTNQPVSIFSGIPPVAREGEKLNTEITIKNGIKSSVDVTLSGAMNGKNYPLSQNYIRLNGGESKKINWNIEIPNNKKEIVYEITAKDANNHIWDKIKNTQQIKSSVPTQVIQSTLSQLDGKNTLNVEQPKDSLANRGGIKLTLSSTLTNNIDSTKYYMQEYPYNCLEQKTSRAIVLDNQKSWKTIMAELPSYLDSDGLAKYFPSMIWGSDTLTSYILSVSHEANFQIPTQTRMLMIEGLRKFVSGKLSRASMIPAADLTFRKITALEAMSKYNEAQVDEVRPFSNPEKMTMWPTSTLISMSNIAKNFKEIPNREEIILKTSQALRSRLNFRGTTMGFSTEDQDRMWWLMISGDENANHFLLSVLDEPSWKLDIPRLVRGSLARQQNGHWDLTTANAFGALAIRKFSKLFEKTKVSGKTTLTFDAKSSEIDWAAKPSGGSLEFGWPVKNTSQDLITVHSGNGKPWLTTQSLAAIPLKKDFFKGFQIQKQWTPVSQKKKGTWSRGDVVRISLTIDAQTDMGWVVVNDPVPTGSTILGSGLANDSKMLTKNENSDSSYPIYIERSFDSFRAYYDFIPKGNWTAEYTFRLNQSGELNLPPTRVEAMYAPEIFGELANASLSVVE